MAAPVRPQKTIQITASGIKHTDSCRILQNSIALSTMVLLDNSNKVGTRNETTLGDDFIVFLPPATIFSSTFSSAAGNHNLTNYNSITTYLLALWNCRTSL